MNIQTEPLSAVDEIFNTAKEATNSLLPVKSKNQYNKCYTMFCEWRRKKMVKDVDENILLAYFFEKAKILKVPTLWSIYSMIKSTLQIHENVDISNYKMVIAFLKRQNDGYEPKKSNILTMENVKKFLIEAPDNDFLLLKVVLIFGLSGACRRAELCALKIEDIVENGSVLVVTLHDTKTKKKRLFTITSECNGIELYKKYFRLRPVHVTHKRFFLFYKNGKCSVQPVGINSFAKIPSKIAEFLKLPNPNSYTGHCVRRTSATFLADSGADIQMLKRHGGWHSSSAAEGYVEESIENKIRTSKRIFDEVKSAPFETPVQSASFVAPVQSASFENPIQSTSFEAPAKSAPFDDPVQSTSFQAPVNAVQTAVPSQAPISFNLNNCIFNVYYDNKNK